ncbi:MULTISPECIES: thioredoxin family protein [unclassified Coleofasciculus]|uniref:thioredoxin family protein n=1 Tax=unclassified Coleofasciculus TaxID=2692782 RepID=UPI0018803378|nr:MULTISPECIES: thioredoxin domain-containing protein [unclassified Coleofasciculus]MBE9130154.1 thiol reductase thioredoxin [Coleofasciculus sp. LEGE 07081]MBE9151265.1 thiol reductase thioredoxin [Coleofasciculus sp. LEGE 07092]
MSVKSGAIALKEGVVKKVIEITDNEFETEVLKAEQSVLVYLWASWCGPCRLVSPSIDWAAENYSDRLKVVKMEIDPNPVTVKQYHVEGVPSLILFKEGEVIQSHEGAIGKQTLLSMLDSHL